MGTRSTKNFNGRIIQNGDPIWYRGDDAIVPARILRMADTGPIKIEYSAENGPVIVSLPGDAVIPFATNANSESDLEPGEWMRWTPITSATADLGSAALSGPASASGETTILSLDVAVTVDTEAMIFGEVGWSYSAAGTLTWRLKVDGVTARTAVGSTLGSGTGDASPWGKVTLSPGAHTITLTGQASTGSVSVASGAAHLAAVALGQT